MRIRVNGEWAEHPDGMTVAELLHRLDLDPRRCAVERNELLVRRAEHPQTRLAENDRLEIVTLVGGG